MSYFIFENKEIFYEEKGEGTPLLILHGNTGSSNMFAGFADRYSADFKVVLIDFLGHGRSDRLSEFPSDLWFYEAQQVIAFLRERVMKKCSLSVLRAVRWWRSMSLWKLLNLSVKL